MAPFSRVISFEFPVAPSVRHVLSLPLYFVNVLGKVAQAKLVQDRTPRSRGARNEENGEAGTR